MTDRFEQEAAEQRKKSFNQIKNYVTKEKYPKWLEEKIINYIERWGDTITKSKSDIIHDLAAGEEYLITILAKDPTKQNTYEKTAIKIFKENNIDIIKLPSLGASKVIIRDNNIEIGKNKKKNDSRALDFKITTMNKIYYISHKYTKHLTGAHQENQLNEQIHFLEKASLVKDSNIIFVALCDGPFYKQENIVTRLQASTTKQAISCDIYKLIEILNNDR